MNNNLSSKAMLVNLHISAWGNSRKNKEVTEKVLEEHGAGQDAGKFVQYLVDPDAVKLVNSTVSRLRAFHNKHTLPWGDNGDRILPSRLYMNEYRAGFNKLHDEFEKAVTQFVSAFPKLKEEAKVRLNGLYKEEHYPDLMELREKYEVKLDFNPLPEVSGDFRSTLTESDRKEVENRLRDQYENSVRDIWKRMAEVVSRMAETLNDPEKKFQNTLVGNVRELVNLIPDLNFVNDPAIEQFRKQIEEKLLTKNNHELSAQDLRDMPSVRADVAKSAEDILSAMSGYIGR